VPDLGAELTALLEPLSRDHGFELVAVEIAGAQGSPIVRIFLDKTDGLTLDEVAGTNEWVSPVLEDYPGLPGAFTLELSSPGIERPLSKRTDFEKYTGSKVKIRTSEPIDERSAFTGTIAAVQGEHVVLDCDGERYRIPLSGIRKANLKVDIDFGNDEGVPR